MRNEIRKYSSRLRRAQAASTHESVIAAAADMFGEHGYSGTTLARIAQAAGVSVETVKLQGTKRELIVEAWEHVLNGPADDTPIFEDADLQEHLAHIPDCELITRITKASAAISRRAYRLWTAMAAAARTDPALREPVDQRRHTRLSECALVVAEFRRRDMLHNAKSDTELAAVAAFLSSGEGYQQLVVHGQMNHSAYCDWLATAFKRLILEG